MRPKSLRGAVEVNGGVGKDKSSKFIVSSATRSSRLSSPFSVFIFVIIKSATCVGCPSITVSLKAK